MISRFQAPKILSISSGSEGPKFFLGFPSFRPMIIIRKLYRGYLKNIGFCRSSIDFVLQKIRYWNNSFLQFKCSYRAPYSIIRFRQYVLAHRLPVSILVSHCRAQIKSPKIFPTEDSLLVTPLLPSYEFNPIQVTTIQNATAIGGTNMVFVGDAVICHDVYDFRSDSTSEELHNRCFIDGNRNEIRWFKKIKIRQSISTAAVFLDACANNYSHWITEVLPRITAFCKQDRFKDIPIIVDEGLHMNLMESLGPIVGGNRKVYTLGRDKSLLVKSLFLVSATGYVPFGVKSKKYSQPSHGAFSSLALKQMREIFLGEIEKLPKRQWPNKIFLSRHSPTRNLLNESQLMLGLLGRGYRLINTAELSFLEQVQLFSGAREIVATTGAALASAIFAPPGAKISVIMSKHEDMIYMYWLNILSPLGVDLTYILGEISSNRHLGIHADYVISDDCVLDFLSDIENL